MNHIDPPGAEPLPDDRFARAVSATRVGHNGIDNEVIDGPVADFATDFDHTDPAWAADPYPIWADLRERCPIARTERFGGAWLPTRHADVAAVAYDTDRFSSRSVIVGNQRPPERLAPVGIAPPISSDPPFHAEARRILLPAFAPRAVERLRATTEAYCDELLDGLAGRSAVDAAADYAQHVPVRVISDLLGFPREDEDRFRGFVLDVLEGANDPSGLRLERLQGVYDYLAEQVVDHVRHPREDLTSFLISAETSDGRPLEPVQVIGTAALLLLAGIDTTWSAIGASLWHLATHPDDRRRLVADPGLLPTATEEFLRAYAPVTMARLVKEDTELGGCPMHSGDWVLLPFPSANRDPDVFEAPDEIRIDRAVNRHAAFGLGIHRCLGSNLARMELHVALERWLRRFPEFTLEDGASVVWSAGQVRGPRSLPVRLGGNAPAA